MVDLSTMLIVMIEETLQQSDDPATGAHEEVSHVVIVWVTALRGVLEAYPHAVLEPLDNTYGFVLATRLALESRHVVMDTTANTPTLYAVLAGPSGARFEFIGLHPRPPLPGQDTTLRDQNILRAGLETPERLTDALVVGDFNDVPWSQTLTTFRQMGGWRDPRQGRGMQPTFPADYAWAGYPLDHVMVKNGVQLRRFDVLGRVGADHRPVRAQVCVVAKETSPVR